VTVGSTSYSVYYIDLNGNDKFDTGDELVITGTDVSGLTVYLYVTGYSGNAQASVPS